MNVDPNITIEDYLREWMDEIRIDKASLQVRVAVDEYRERVEYGTMGARVKHANENLQKIELHARALSRAIDAMPVRATWAISRSCART